MAAIGLQVLNHATVGMFRIPAITIGCLGGALVGELVRRVFKNLANTNTYTQQGSLWVYEKSPKLIKDIVDVVDKADWKTIVTVSAVCFTFHIAAMEALNFAFGAPHVYYNVFLGALTYLKIQDAPNYHTTLVQKAIDVISPTV